MIHNRLSFSQVTAAKLDNLRNPNTSETINIILSYPLSRLVHWHPILLLFFLLLNLLLELLLFSIELVLVLLHRLFLFPSLVLGSLVCLHKLSEIEVS